MKKKLFVFSSVMTIMALISCSTASVDIYEENADDSEVCVEESYARLNNDILVLNLELSQQETRGFLGRLFKSVLNVFIADVVGAVKGVFTGDNIWQSAQGSSFSSAKKQGFITGVYVLNEIIGNAPRRVAMLGDTLATSCVQPREDALNNLVLVQNPLLATANDSLGFYHNLIIYNTLEKNNSVNYWKSVSDEACVLKLNEEIISTIPVSCYSDVSISDETIQFCSFIGEESVKCENYKELINVAEVKYPELEEILNVISLYFEGMELVETDEEWEQYCKDVIDLISNSGLSERDKESLKAGVTVGYASSKLWKCEE